MTLRELISKSLTGVLPETSPVLDWPIEIWCADFVDTNDPLKILNIARRGDGAEVLMIYVGQEK